MEDTAQRPTGHRSAMAGFTLLELMITLAIIAMLAAVALPLYQNQVQKARRADAIQALEYAAARQEQHYFQHQRYSDAIAELGGSRSPDGHYVLSVTLASNGQGYTLTATASGPQQQDSQCGSYTLNQVGERKITGTGGVATCWKRGR